MDAKSILVNGTTSEVVLLHNFWSAHSWISPNHRDFFEHQFHIRDQFYPCFPSTVITIVMTLYFYYMCRDYLIRSLRQTFADVSPHFLVSMFLLAISPFLILIYVEQKQFFIIDGEQREFFVR